MQDILNSKVLYTIMDENNFTRELDENARIWKELSVSEQELLIKISNYLSLDKGNFDMLINDDALKLVKAKNIVREENEQIIFTSSVMSVYLQAQSTVRANDLLDRASQEIITFLTYQSSKSHDQVVTEWNSYVCCIFFILINEHQRKDLLTLLSDRDRYWHFSEALNLLIPSLKLSLEEFASFLGSVYEVTKHDSAASFYYSAISRFGFFHPQNSLELIYFLISKIIWLSSPVIENLLLGISSVSLEFQVEAVRLAEDWQDSPITSLREKGLHVLLQLLLKDKYEVDKFVKLATKQMESVQEELAFSLGYIFTKIGLNYPNFSGECSNQIEKLKNISNVSQANNGISSALAEYRSTTNDFFWQCLSFLSDTPVQDKGTIRNIDSVLFPFTTSNPTIVWRFIEDWILKHDRIESVIERDMFSSPIHYSYRADPQLGLDMVTTWFRSDHYHLIEEARKIINELRIQSFSKRVLEEISIEDTIFIVEKLLIGHLESNHLFLLFFSVVNNTVHFDQLSDYFSEILFNLAWMYPGASKDFFDQQSVKDESEPGSYLVQLVAPRASEYQSSLQKARSIIKQEFPASLRRSRKYHEFESKKMQSISRSVMEDDHYSLTSWIPKVMVGRGDRSFHMNIFDPDPEKRRTFSNLQGFAEFSRTFEMPITELIDPEGELISRFERLNLRKQDIQVNNE